MTMLLVGTTNQHKLEEIRSLLTGLVEDVQDAAILPNQSPVPEQGTTFLTNAKEKAKEFARRALALPASARPRWVVADDSGLAVNALGGSPGVYSARYAGEGCTYEDNNRKLLAALESTADDQRGARFVCAVVCCEVGAKPDVVFEVEGYCSGHIARAPRGHGGFGYDPVFVEESTGKTFAELAPEEKNLLSHRAQAMSRLRSWLERQIRRPK